ncbi:MAG: ubiquinol-cytochrome c reductase iron-sulfur subunit [Candidatus Marinimicrobia bacterium]|nr:ubiquinol-cytochrome c reductase iron-sulfur subunit [Candidatus Neomarinimicrobiota bacterium]
MNEIKTAPPASVGASTNDSNSDNNLGRRGFFKWLSLGWIAFAGATGGFFTVCIRFLFPNVLFEPPQTFKIGFPDDYATNAVDIRYKKQHNVWVVRDDETMFALSTTCTHLGCTPNWLQTEGKFKCPCHGSGFRMTGINFEGPAPRPLERYKISISNDGQILVDKTKSFKWEKGEWENQESYLKV